MPNFDIKKKFKKGRKNRHFCNGRSPFQRPHSKLKMKKFYNESNCYGIFFSFLVTNQLVVTTYSYILTALDYLAFLTDPTRS